MLELLRPMATTLRGMWLNRWLGILVAWAVAIMISGVIWMIPDRYESSAKIFVDTQTILRPVMTGLAIQPSVDQQAALVGKTLISRPNIEKLIQTTDLAALAKTERDREVLAEQLMRRFEVKLAGRENLYSLSFWDSDPVRAKMVVEKLAAIFVESTQGAGRKDTSAAKEFVREQIEVYEEKLRDAENRLKEFRLRNLGIADSGKDYFGKVDELNTLLTQARLELREAENSRDALARQISGESAVIVESRDSNVAPTMSELDARIDAVQRNLDSLLQRFTEDHPDVVGAKRVLAGLEEQRRKERSGTERGGGTARITSSSANPVYREIKVALAKSDASVASLRARVSEYEARYRQYKDAARMVPQIEAELAQLNRDYEINKKTYEALVARRESLGIGGEMQDAGASQVRIVDFPRIPPRPFAPNRPLMFLAGLILAIGAGVAAGFLVSRVRPRFFDTAALREVTGLPVLGAVSMRSDSSYRWRSRRRVIGFLSALAALVVGYLGSAMAYFMLATRVS